MYSRLVCDDATSDRGAHSQYLELLRPDALIGTRIDGYEILGIVAEGGMGVVVEARDGSGGVVAMKILKIPPDDPLSAECFRREVAALRRLTHPCTIEYLGHGACNVSTDTGFVELPYLITEYVHRARSVTRYADDESLSLRDRLHLVDGLCDAVHEAHRVGIVHRDIKPSNVLVDGHRRLKLIDFGLASFPGDRSASVLTHDGQIAGTLAYMSPEQRDGMHDLVDHRSDVYALGRLLQALAPSPPVELRRVVSRATRRSRRRRYQSVSDMRDDIRRVIAGGTPRRRRRVAVLATAIAAPIAIAILVTTGLVSRAPNQHVDVYAHPSEDVLRAVRQHGEDVATFWMHENPRPDFSSCLEVLHAWGPDPTGLERLLWAEGMSHTLTEGGFPDQALATLRAVDPLLEQQDPEMVLRSRTSQLDLIVATGSHGAVELIERTEEVFAAVQEQWPKYHFRMLAACAFARRMDEERTLGWLGDLPTVATSKTWPNGARMPQQHRARLLLGAARVYIALDDRDRALSFFERAVQLQSYIYQLPLHARMQYPGVLWLQGRYDLALQKYATLEDELASGMEYTSELLTMRNSMATCLRDLGRLEEARALYETVIQTRDTLFGPDCPYTANVRINLAWTLVLQATIDGSSASDQLLESASVIADRTADAMATRDAGTQRSVELAALQGHIHYRRGKYSEAIQPLRDAHDAYAQGSVWRRELIADPLRDALTRVGDSHMLAGIAPSDLEVIRERKVARDSDGQPAGRGDTVWLHLLKPRGDDVPGPAVTSRGT